MIVRIKSYKSLINYININIRRNSLTNEITLTGEVMDNVPISFHVQNKRVGYLGHYVGKAVSITVTSRGRYLSNDGEYQFQKWMIEEILDEGN